MTLASVLLSFAAGCATQADSSDPTLGEGGGKGDGTAATESGAMPEVADADQGFMRAADAECFHMKYLESGDYGANIKVFCLPRGGVAAPIAVYVAAVSPGEVGAVYKIFELPGFMSAVPGVPTFRMVGTKAVVTFKAKVPADSETDTLTYATRTFTATLAFSGDVDAPDVRATYSKQ